MSRLRRKISRPEGKNRDASLFIIASEGKETEKIYVEALEEFFNSKRIHIRFIHKKDPSKSSPKHTLESIAHVRREYHINELDQLWILIDRDQWEDKELSYVATECIKKKINLAVSNPCFELWCVLHLKKISEYSREDLMLLSSNKKDGTKTFLEKELSYLLKGASKTSKKIGELVPDYEVAVQNSKEIDPNPKLRWPESPGTRVYLLLEEINKFIEGTK